MKSSRLVYSLAPLAAAVAACTPAEISVEVLPPRTSVTCSAPTVSEPASSRGLLDVRGTETLHGAYRADLRLSIKGADAHVDGIQVKYALDGADLGDYDGAVVGGDAVLLGEDEDIRQVVVENAELLPRDAAIDLLEDDDLSLSDVAYETLTITLTPVLRDGDESGATALDSTFALELCDGCLVTPPSLEECPAGPAQNFVCRPGQDQKLFACAGGA
jgi:hypothetical protein